MGKPSWNVPELPRHKGSDKMNQIPDSRPDNGSLDAIDSMAKNAVIVKNIMDLDYQVHEEIQEDSEIEDLNEEIEKIQLESMKKTLKKTSMEEMEKKFEKIFECLEEIQEERLKRWNGIQDQARNDKKEL